jgi:hypothetical protein
MVSGTPSSLLSEPIVAVVGARNHGRQQVLGAGLALGAGQSGNGQPVAQPGHDVGGECLQRGPGVVDDDGGQRSGPGAEHGHRA